VDVEAFVAVSADAVLGIFRAFGRAPEVVFVQVIALLDTFAETTEPMLAYYTAI
jgi:hypothetical protein